MGEGPGGKGGSLTSPGSRLRLILRFTTGVASLSRCPVDWKDPRLEEAVGEFGAGVGEPLSPLAVVALLLVVLVDVSS